jgi:hypothetical protein
LDRACNNHEKLEAIQQLYEHVGTAIVISKGKQQVLKATSIHLLKLKLSNINDLNLYQAIFIAFYFFTQEQEALPMIQYSSQCSLAHSMAFGYFRQSH